TVTTFEDELNTDGDCSLREALQAAATDTAVDACEAGSGADRVILPAGTFVLLGAANENGNLRGDLDISTEVTIQGDAAGTVIDGGGRDRIIEVHAGGNVTLRALTITGGKEEVGGGIRNAGTLTVDNCVVTGNTAIRGGGIANFGA